MDWTEIKVSVNAKHVGTASDIAHMTVPYGIYIEDYSNLERINPDKVMVLTLRMFNERLTTNWLTK